MSVREIKFRCYDKEEGYMLPWEHLVQAGDLPEMLLHGHEEDESYSKLMQFTRLKDKNGVEIYEGDILQYKAYSVSKRWWSTMEEIEVIKAEVEEQRKNFYMCVGEVSYADGDLKIGFDLSGKDLARGERIEVGSGRSGDYERKSGILKSSATFTKILNC